MLFILHCAAHAVDVVIEQIGKLDPFHSVVVRAYQVMQLIVSHALCAVFTRLGVLRCLVPGTCRALRVWVLNRLHWCVVSKAGHPHCRACPGDTRSCAAAYFTCARLLTCESSLRRTVVSIEWDRWASETGNEEAAAAVKAIILDAGFWSGIAFYLRLLKPMVQLRKLAAHDTPTMGG